MMSPSPNQFAGNPPLELSWLRWEDENRIFSFASSCLKPPYGAAMHRSPFLAALLFVCICVVLVDPAHATWPNDPNNNLPVCIVAGDQDEPAIVSDGFGGVIIAWHDGRGSNYDIYGQRVNAAGVPQWVANGVPLCSA